MIIEGLLTTLNEDREPNVAPFGPVVCGNFERLILRPWKGSTTYDNLRLTQSAVFHVVDEVDVIARAAIGRLTELPEMTAARHVSGWVLNECCHYYELSIQHADFSHDRAELTAEIVHQESRNGFQGFNRAKHAILEAAILATRTHLLNLSDITADFGRLESAVRKTGTDEHKALFQVLTDFVRSQYPPKEAAANLASEQTAQHAG